MLTFVNPLIKFRSAWLLVNITAVVFISSCSLPSKPDTGLYGKATHTGTLYIYRVPQPGDRSIAQYSRLQELMDLDDLVENNGVVKPNLHVTEDDLITVSLGTAFIKYFKEGSASGESSAEDRRKGEIVIVISFDAGTTKRESFVVFASGDQTLGSFLSVQNWPMLGPLKVDGSDLKIRIVMLELDQAENEKIKQLTRFVGNTAGQLQPGLAPGIKIVQPLAEAIIALNGDDVILDQRFAFQRIDKARNRSDIQRPPLLFGKYVLIMQEDRLRGDDVNTVAPDAADPPAPSNIRFDLDSNRLYRVYDYWTDRWGWPRTKDKDGNSVSEIKPTNATGPKYIDLGVIDDLGGCPPEKDKNGKEFDYAEHQDAAYVRTYILGYQARRTTGLERWNCLENALRAAYCEGLRGTSASTNLVKDSPGYNVVSSKACDQDELSSKNRLHLNYPVRVFPTANAVLAQYPLHTHLVLTIEESLGGPGVPIHEAVSSLEEFTQKQLDSVKDGEFAKRIGDRLIDAKLENKKQIALLKKVKAEPNHNEKLCLLFNEIKNDNKENVLNYSPLYNQVYKITGEVVNTPKEVAGYLRGSDANCIEKDTCSCAESAEKFLKNI